MDDIVQHNKAAWNKKVAEKNKWTQPVSYEEIQRARSGQWQVLLTPCKPVPTDWFPIMKDADVLCLASGGGQQAPIFAAAGANVTSFDNSPAQLEQDQFVAKREGLEITIVEGDMADLSPLQDSSFDFVFNPVSTCFIPSVVPVWKEVFRVLRPGGSLVTGFVKPFLYIFDSELYDQGIFVGKHSLPYSDISSISDEERIGLYGEDEAIEFSHTLDDQIGGQITAGFLLAGFYEDFWEDEKINDLIPSFIATRAIKPEH